ENVQMGIALLGNIISTRSDISSIFIFNNEGIALYKTSPIDINADFDYKSQEWYKKAIISPSETFVIGPAQPVYAKSQAADVFSICRSIESYDGSGELGVILIDSNLSMVRNYCNSSKLINDGFIFVVNGSGKVVYSPDGYNPFNMKETTFYTDLNSNVIGRLEGSADGNFNADIMEQSHQVVFKKMDRTDWYVIAVSPTGSITSEANKVRDLIVLVGLLCLTLVIVLSILLSQRITKPIVQLKDSMDMADHGNLDIRVPVRTSDEVGQLSESFNHMLERIDGLMKQTISDQEEKRKLELKVLQHQINPHFLYNTLDSIIWMAELKDDNVVPMTEALSNLFRLSLSRGQEMIPLRDELDHVRNYLFIQSMRYLNKFSYDFTVEEYLLKYMTLKIILQPLVENSIYHGIKNKEGKCAIHISAAEKDGKLVIAVEDDGIGMDEQTCRNILDENHEQMNSDTSGIGVRNVHARIRLYFGSEYGLSFKSTLGEGTTVYVTLPLLES
ncbi:MAG: histidine kinase, partial [Saccharofermentanales bacterium]